MRFSFSQLSSGIVLASISFLVGCPRPPQSVPELKLRQEWFANANFAGAVLASEQFASDHHIAIKIEEGSETVNTVSLVTAGNSDFGDAAADSVLIAISNGAPLVIVGVVNPTSPTVFLALKDKNINSPREFEGHKVGVLSGTATEYVYRSLLKHAGVRRERIKEIEIGFELQSFLSGAYDVRPAFDYDEPVSLDLQHVEYTKIDPRVSGVHFIGTVYFTRRELVTNNPDLVQNMVSALADGWRLAVNDPNRAIIALTKRYSTLSAERELASLNQAIKYVKPPSGRLLTATLEDWRGTLEALKDLGLIKDLSLDNVVDDSFINKYYATEVGDLRDK